MSTRIQDLYHYEIVKKCSKGGISSLKNIFHKQLASEDDLVSQCSSCVIQNEKEHDYENRESKTNFF